MQNEGLLKAFIEMSKKAQQERESQRIVQLRQGMRELSEKYTKLEDEYMKLREQSIREMEELKRANIKLQAQNKAIKLRNTMLEEIVKQAQGNSGRLNMGDLSAMRIVSQQNKALKQLLRSHLSD